MNTEAVKEILRRYNRKETKEVMIQFKTDPVTVWTLHPTCKHPPVFNVKAQTLSCAFTDEDGYDCVESISIDLIDKVRFYAYEVPPTEEKRYKAKVD